jgi:hypothetical protein
MQPLPIFRCPPGAHTTIKTPAAPRPSTSGSRQGANLSYCGTSLARPERFELPTFGSVVPARSRYARASVRASITSPLLLGESGRRGGCGVRVAVVARSRAMIGCACRFRRLVVRAVTAAGRSCVLAAAAIGPGTVRRRPGLSRWARAVVRVTRVALSWSGGKDSAVALRALREELHTEPVAS